MNKPAQYSETVFVIDDDPAVLDSLTLILRMHGFRAQTFGSARQFLENLPPTDRGAVVIDVNMPEQSGIALLQHLKAAHYKLPCLMMTGSGQISDAVKAMKNGAFDFIEKPFDSESFISSVKAALESSYAAADELHFQDQARRRIEGLTPREREVFLLLAKGEPNKKIGFELGISARTVEIHRAHVMNKLGAKSLADIVRFAINSGIYH